MLFFKSSPVILRKFLFMMVKCSVIDMLIGNFHVESPTYFSLYFAEHIFILIVPTTTSASNKVLESQIKDCVLDLPCITYSAFVNHFHAGISNLYYRSKLVLGPDVPNERYPDHCPSGPKTKEIEFLLHQAPK